jgi:DNA polymerase-3 subunit alpha
VNRRVLESLVKCGAFDSTGAHRAQNMAVIDEALEQGQKMGKDREGGPDKHVRGLYRSAAPEPRFAHSPCPISRSGKRLRPWSTKKRPWAFTSPAIPSTASRMRSSAFPAWTPPDWPRPGTGPRCTWPGCRWRCKEKITKKGDRMAFVRMEDLKGSVELIVLPDCYNISRPKARCWSRAWWIRTSAG